MEHVDDTRSWLPEFNPRECRVHAQVELVISVSQGSEGRDGISELINVERGSPAGAHPKPLGFINDLELSRTSAEHRLRVAQIESGISMEESTIIRKQTSSELSSLCRSRIYVFRRTPLLRDRLVYLRRQECNLEIR